MELRDSGRKPVTPPHLAETKTRTTPEDAGNPRLRAERPQQLRSHTPDGVGRSAGNPSEVCSLQFNEDGRILPHTLLGSLEDFRKYLEAKGETQLLKRIPESSLDCSSETSGVKNSSAFGSGHRNIHGADLWDTQMRSQKQSALFGVSSETSQHRHDSLQEAAKPKQSLVGPISQRHVGVQVLFETQTGDPAWSVLNLRNGGCSAISYSWHRLPKRRSFQQLHSQEKTHFYFNSSSGVICPNEVLQVEVLFMSEKPGIRTEHWELNTTGVSLRVTLMGVCLQRDPSAELQLHLRAKLDKKAVWETCQLILSQMLEKIYTPRRPSSPPYHLDSHEQNLGITKGEAELLKGLKIMWREMKGRDEWDLSVDTLRQCALSLPDVEPVLGPSIREERLTQLNKMLLQDSEPSELKHLHLTAVAAGRQLWRNMLETMAVESDRIQDLLGLPEIQMWGHEEGHPSGEVTNNQKNRNREKGVAGERRGRSTADSKGAFDPPSTGDLQKKGVQNGPVGHLEGSPLPSRNPQAQSFRRMLLKKVYALMEELLDGLCDISDELRRA